MPCVYNDAACRKIALMPNESAANPKVLILTVSHGASHRRTGEALRQAFLALRPQLNVELEDGLSHCASWFQVYYNSYLIPLKLWPGLWARIETRQHQSASTGPGWLYRRGAKPFFQFLQRANPEIVVATEVGMGELAALFKRETKANFFLAASCGLDADRAWIQPEVDLYIVPPGDTANDLARWGAPQDRILACGMPVNPAFANLPDSATARARLGLPQNLPLLLVLFGGSGFGKLGRILPELSKIAMPHHQAFIAGKNRRLLDALEAHCTRQQNCRAYGWVDNIHEWMAAADLLLSKPGTSTLNEALNAGLPILAIDPLPGNEQRFCAAIEKWEVGRWMRRPEQLAATIEKLWSDRQPLERLRQNALSRARPHAAHAAAETILKRWEARR